MESGRRAPQAEDRETPSKHRQPEAEKREANAGGRRSQAASPQAESEKHLRSSGEQTGRFSINAIPWAEVYMDGRKLGNTPLRAQKVSVGEHRFHLLHPPNGRSFDFRARIEVDRGQIFVVDLLRGKLKQRWE